MLSVDEIKRLLGLRPLEPEGGYFAETYRSSGIISPEALPEVHTVPKPLATAIYYMLTPDSFSALHRLPSDEIYHFYLGDPVEMLLLLPDNSSHILRLGDNLLESMQLQVVVSAGVWQGARLAEGGNFALLGTTMSPGYDPEDYEEGKRDELIRAYPDQRELITALTR
jgi:predicted cupin superfamily sugar epimerase